MNDGDMPGASPRQDQLFDEASAWFARMRRPDAELYRQEFEAWLARGAAHRGAYNRAGEVYALGKFLAGAPAVPANRDDSGEMAGGRRNGRLALAAGLAVTVGLGALIGMDRLSQTSTPQAQFAARPAGRSEQRQFATGRTDRQRIALTDGSTVTLEAGSTLSIRFDAQRRELHLASGRARFEVAHEARPFVVFAGGGSVTARGTIFDVAVAADDGVTVHLLRGAVDVTRPIRPGLPPAEQVATRLAAGEALSFGGSAALDPAPGLRALAADLPPQFAAGAREFDEVPLSEVIAETNLTSDLTIRITDPAIGALKVSGRFRVDDPNRVAERLASLFDLEIDRSRPKEIMLRTR